MVSQNVTSSRPDNSLPIEPTVETVEQAESALRELGWIAAVKKTIDAETERRIAAVHAEADAAKIVDVDGSVLTIAERERQLNEALFSFGEQHRDTLCPRGIKTAQFQHGRLRWAKQRDAVEYRDGEDHKSVINRIGERDGLLDRLYRAVARLKLGDIVTVALKLNLTKARDAFLKRQVDGETLSDLGLQFREGDEYIHAEPAQFVISGPTIEQ